MHYVRIYMLMCEPESEDGTIALNLDGRTPILSLLGRDDPPALPGRTLEDLRQSELVAELLS